MLRAGELHVDEWLLHAEEADPFCAAASLTCAICLDLLLQPVHLSTCAHVFCRSCLQGHVAQYHLTCPQCVIPLQADIAQLLASEADSVDAECNARLSSIQVGCPYCRKWQGVLGVDRAELIAHRDGCGDYPLICGVGCGRSIARSRVAQHEHDECGRREVECERCGETLPAEYVAAQHGVTERECENAHLCTLGCGDVVLDSCLSDHCKHHCPYRNVACPTCGVSVQQRQLEAHLHTNFIDHFSRLATDNISFRQQLAAMQDKMAQFGALQDEVAFLRAQVAAASSFPTLAHDVQTAVEWLDGDASVVPDPMKDTVTLMRQYKDMTDGQFASYQQLLDRANAANPAYAVEGQVEGGVENIVSAMRLYKALASVQEAGCGVLWKLADGVDASLRIAAAGGIEAILAAMRQHPSVAVLQENGCAALCRMSRHALLRSRLAQCGVAELIVAAVKTHTLTVRIRELGFQALCDLSRDPAIGVRLGNAGGVEYIMGVLRQHSAAGPLPPNELTVLWNLAANPALATSLVLAGGIECVGRAMTHHAAEQRVQELGLAALRHLQAAVQQHQQSSNMTQPSRALIDCLVTALRRCASVASVQEHCLTELANLIRSGPQYRELIGATPHAIESILAALVTHDKARSVQELCVFILCRLTEFKAITARIFAAGGKAAIQAAMARDKANMPLQSNCTCALNRMKT